MQELMIDDALQDGEVAENEAITSLADVDEYSDAGNDTDSIGPVDYDRIEEIVRSSVDSLGLGEVGADVQALRADVKSLGEEQATDDGAGSQVVTIDASQFATISDFIEHDTGVMHLLNYYGLSICVLLALSIGLSLFHLLVGRK